MRLGQGWRRRWPAWASAALAVLLAAALWAPLESDAPAGAEGEATGAWVSLSDLPWERAQAGRAVLISESLPVRGAAFDGSPLRMSGVPFERGLGVTADSEIVYALGGQYRDFAAVAGLDDASPGDDPALRFLVFLDDVLAYDSGVLRRGDPPQPLEVPAAGIQQLRLVTRGAAGYGDWADAQVRVAAPGPQPVSSFLDRLLDERRRLSGERSRGRAQALETAAQERRSLDFLLGRRAVEAVAGVRFVSAPGRLTLTTDALSVGLGYGGPDHGRITVLDLAGNRLLLNHISPTVELVSGERYRLAEDFLPVFPRAVQTQAVDDPGFGPGRELRARFHSRDGRLELWAAFRLYQRHPALLYQLGVEGLPPDEPVAFLLLDPAQGGAVPVGKQPLYLTDYNRMRLGGVPDDGLLREERVGHGKPVWLWSPEGNRGLLLAAIDETAASPYFTVRRAPGAAEAEVVFASGAARSPAGGAQVSPRLYLEATYTTHLQDAFAHFRATMAALYPPLPFPSWVQHQWLSWYVHYFDISEGALRKQVDQIAERFASVGSWHLLVDAGWYVGEGRPDADWRNVDRDKFPDGLRAFVDDAHRRGVNIVLYFGTPYLNTQEAPGNWMGLTGLARRHPDWLIQTGADDTTEHYLMNYAQPELRAYVRQVMEDFYRNYGVDGMKVDGLASAEGGLPPGAAGTAWLLGEGTAGQTMDIYRATAAAARAAGGAPYIESGWSSPVFAHPYAHTFRFGDEAPAFSNPYPMGGLVEHIDYAAYQAALGQPANMGAIYGDPNTSAVPRWWLEAALAMGNQVALSFDLEALEPGPRNHLRALLAHYRPFAGQTHFDGRVAPEVFAATVGPLTYLGALNRSPAPRRFTVELERYGVPSGAPVTAYDVEQDRFFPVHNGRLTVETDGESFRLVILRTAPGVLWSSGGFTEQQEDGGLTVTLRGLPDEEGMVYLAAPPPAHVALDGEEIAPEPETEPGPARFRYDEATGVLTVGVPPGAEHTLTLRFGPVAP